MTVHQSDPLNSEPTVQDLVNYFYTPISLSFNRNHCSFPDPTFQTSWSLHVFDGDRPVWKGGLKQLKGRVPEKDLRAVLQCAGNRRDELSETLQTEGVQWAAGTLSNILWTGIPLKSFLVSLDLDLKPSEMSACHVHFESSVGPCEEEAWYGSSLSLHEIMKGDAPPFLLAYKANHQPLDSPHGAPLRLITPGIIGARSVKWLERISIRSYPSKNHYETLDYKILPPSLTSASTEEKHAAMRSIEPLERWSINSVIGSCRKVDGGKVVLRGYAVGSGGIPLEKVQVYHYSRPPSLALIEPDPSLNLIRDEVARADPSHWQEASLERGPEGDGDGLREWGWVLWEHSVPISKESSPNEWVVARAVDLKGNRQLRMGAWNLRGVGMSAWPVKKLCRTLG